MALAFGGIWLAWRLNLAAQVAPNDVSLPQLEITSVAHMLSLPLITAAVISGKVSNELSQISIHSLSMSDVGLLLSAPTPWRCICAC